MTTTLALARFRLRPVPWGWLAVLAAGWFLLTGCWPPFLGDPELGVMVFRWAALLLGLGGAVLAAPETDPPRDLLRAAPVPRWRTLALRLAGWLALGAAPVLALAVLLDGTAGWTAADLARGTLPNFLLATAAGVPGRQPDLGPWRRRGRYGRHGRAGYGRAGLAGLVPCSAPERPRRSRFGRPAGPGWSGSAWRWSRRRCCWRRGPARGLGLPRRRRPIGPAQPRVRGQGPAMIGVARAALDAATGAAPDRGITATAADDELVRAVAAGDRHALELLYRRHAPWLAGRLAAATSSRELAEEALQDTFLAAWRGARAYHGTGEVPAWLWGIARRRLASLARRQPQGSLSLEVAGERVDPASGPEEAALGRDASARIRPAVAHLPDDQRAAITAVVYQGQTITQAALAARVPEGTIKSRLHRARLHIRKELEP